MKTAGEIMNRSFFYASPSDSIGQLLRGMSERALGSVVVLGLDGRPLGVATRAEVESCHDAEELARSLRRSAVCMDEHTPIDIAVRTLALHPSCSLVLLDAMGVAVGVLSPLELLRAELGIESDHALLQYDRDSGWNAAELLELAAAHRVPAAPGIILLSPGFDQSAKRIVWAEATENMRERLDQMLRNPQLDARLEAILEVYPRTARFRYLTMYDCAQRERLAGALCNVPGCARCASKQAIEPALPGQSSPGSAPRAEQLPALDS